MRESYWEAAGGASKLQVLEKGANFGAGPVLGADKLTANNALAIDDVGFRPHFSVEKFGCGLVGVAHRDEVDAAADEKAAIGIGIFVDADGEDGKAWLVLVELEERGKFYDAGSAPGGPEVEQNHMAAIVGEVDGGLAVGDSEVGGFLAYLAGMYTAIAGRDERQRKEKNDGEKTKISHILIIRSNRAGRKVCDEREWAGFDRSGRAWRVEAGAGAFR